MLLKRSRHVQILPLLIAVCRLTLAFPTQTSSAFDDVRQLQVKIPHSGPVSAPLGSSISIPCLVYRSSSSPVAPRVKWTVVSDGVETQILVARGERVKVNEAYRDRAAWLNYTSSPDDLSLWLGDLRSSDSGHYRCEVQQGLEDASDLVQLKVKGVVFHYRDALGRYAFSFHQAQRACEAIGAQITTPDQLLAAYYDGYEQCDAGWLADQSVRYPIQVPREGCYGDMDGQPGVRNYGTMDQHYLYDVYCYVEETDGEVFHDSIPQQLSFDEAQSYCRAAGAELATTAKLYLAWSEGLDRCSPGWLSDGSVRYPIIAPRERCGGPQPGVKTLYRFNNQTGFPQPSSLHDVYCFRHISSSPTDSPMENGSTEPEDIRQDVVILMETDQELQLNQHVEQGELKAQRVLESFPLFSSKENPTAVSDTTGSPLNTTPTLELLQALNETSSPTENSSPPHTALMNTTFRTTETYDSLYNISSLPSVYNDTVSYSYLNVTVHQSEPESTTGFPKSSSESHTDKWTVPNPHLIEKTSEMPKDLQETQATYLDFDRSQANYSETDGNHTQEVSLWEMTSMTPDPMGLEEETVENPVQVFLSSQASSEEELVTQPAQTTKSTIMELTSLWARLDGSGDISQERDLEMEAVRLIHASDSSTSGITTHASPSTSASSASIEPQTAFPEFTFPSGSHHPSTVSLDIFSTASQLWDSPISTQEGSSSLEIEDTVTLESKDKMLHPTMSEVSLVPTESPGGSNPSQLPTGSINARYQTSGYRVYLESKTTGYEEASGHELSRVTAILGEDITLAPTNEEDVNVTPTQVPFLFEEEAITAPTLEEEMYLAPTIALEEEAKASPTAEEEADVSAGFIKEVNVSQTLEENNNTVPTLGEEASVASTLEEEFSIAANLEEEASVAPTLEEEASVAPTLEEEAASVGQTLKDEETSAPTLEEVESVAPTLQAEPYFAPTLKEEASSSPTLEEEASVAPTLEAEANVSPTLKGEETSALTLHEEKSVAPTLEAEAYFAPTLKGEETSAPTLQEEESVAPTLQAEAYFAPTLKGEVTSAPTLQEEESVAPTFEEEAAPTFEEDLTIFPLESQTPNWTPLTTTTGPQESLNDLEYSRMNFPITSTAAPDSSSRTKPNAATRKSTTHWSRRAWSPTTSAANTFHQTAEPWKVSTFIPPVDQGLVDSEFSLTQTPTTLILPNERAAVGGTWKASDACVVDPCLNGGTCTDQDGQIQCLCLPSYGGDFCQTDLERCEPGWDKFHGFCYRHFSRRLSWEVAEQHCRMLGAHLVSIITPEEQSYINNNYKEYQWTGLNDKTIEDDFRWSDGNPMLYENWYIGQPDSYFLSGEDCVVMVWHDEGRWSDVPCNYHLAYTCKKGTSSCGPPPRVRNASVFGKGRQRYETNAVVRYHCAWGFQQRFTPLIRCLSGGRWETPQVLCIPEAGGPIQLSEVTSETNDNYAAIEDEFEPTKETPQFWDIKF